MRPARFDASSLAPMFAGLVIGGALIVLGRVLSRWEVAA